MDKPLLGVKELFALPRYQVVITDCPVCADPPVRIGDILEFRNPDGSVFRSAVAGIETADPYDPARSFAFAIPPDTPAAAVQIGAEVWSLCGEPAGPPTRRTRPTIRGLLNPGATDPPGFS